MTVDVVVRDRAGQPVVDLSQDDFEVLEDGVRQRIISIETRSGLVEGDESGASMPAAPLVEGASSGQAIVALVFHQLFPQGRAAAAAAARSMVESLAPDEYVGVFDINLNLTMVSPFTRERAALRKALDNLLKTPAVQRGPATSALGVAEVDGPPGRHLTPDGEIAATMRARMAGDFEGAHRAAVQSASLLDVIARLARFPGRKSIVLFSEGLNVSPRLESVVVRALSENVTVYTVHAGGLGTIRRFAVPDRKIDSRELTSTNRRGRESWRSGFLMMDPTAGLAPLAKHTGGFLVSDTNDLKRALTEINRDRHAFYVLAYSSSKETLDGTTRQIEVRVKRPGVRVHARTAYVAAVPEAIEGASSEEQRALSVLSRLPRPREFEFVARAYRTPKPERPYLVSLVMEVPAAALTFHENAASKKYLGHVSILTRLIQGQRVVASQYQMYRLTGDLKRLPAFRQRPLSYFRTLTVPPGSYRLEIVVLDSVENRASTTELELASEPSEEICVGDLVIVQEVKRVDAKKASEHPFGWHRSIVTPRLGNAVDARGRTSLLLAVPLVAPSRVVGKVGLSGPNGPLTEMPVSFDPPAQDGSDLRFIELPIANLPSGTYALTLTIDGTANPIVRDATFVLSSIK